MTEQNKNKKYVPLWAKKFDQLQKEYDLHKRLSSPPNQWSSKGMSGREARKRVEQHKHIATRALQRQKKFSAEAIDAGKRGASSLARKRRAQSHIEGKRYLKTVMTGLAMQNVYKKPTKIKKP